VVLQDDKHLEAADNVIPILRSAVATDEAKTVLNSLSAKLTTADLVQMNAQVQLEHQDPDAVARAWLEQHNFGM
jgi:osmoprotectant transport system substrate-binding protein